MGRKNKRKKIKIARSIALKHIKTMESLTSGYKGYPFTISWPNIIKAQNNKCFLCEKNMHPNQMYKNPITREHVIPKSLWKIKDSEDKVFIVAAHRICNQLKANHLPSSNLMKKLVELKLKIIREKYYN